MKLQYTTVFNNTKNEYEQLFDLTDLVKVHKNNFEVMPEVSAIAMEVAQRHAKEFCKVQYNYSEALMELGIDKDIRNQAILFVRMAKLFGDYKAGDNRTEELDAIADSFLDSYSQWLSNYGVKTKVKNNERFIGINTQTINDPSVELAIYDLEKTAFNWGKWQHETKEESEAAANLSGNMVYNIKELCKVVNLICDLTPITHLVVQDQDFTVVRLLELAIAGELTELDSAFVYDFYARLDFMVETLDRVDYAKHVYYGMGEPMRLAGELPMEAGEFLGYDYEPMTEEEAENFTMVEKPVVKEPVATKRNVERETPALPF